MSKAILVAGMHRSGTSATTGALRMCGVSLGAELIPAAADNRLGYWENARAVAIHEELLEGLGRSWDDVRALPQEWLQTNAARAAAVQIEKLVNEEFASEQLWAVKDPRICRFLPLWKEVLGRLGIPMVVLMVARRPSEVAASIQKRNGWMSALSELLWQRHVFEAERDSRGLLRCAVTYDEMIANPKDTMLRALGRLGVVVAHESQASASELERFISGDERHHSHDLEGTGSVNVAEEAYRLLCSIARGNEGWDELSRLGDAFEASPEANSCYVEALADSGWKLRQRDKESNAALATVKSSLHAQIEWSEEAVERHQRLDEELVQTRSNLIAQVRWSEEAVERERRLEHELQVRATSLEVLKAANCSLQGQRACLEDELLAARDELASVQTRLAGVLGSFSWKMTAPIRVIERLVSPKPPNGSSSR